jgi:fructokinase
MRLGVDLGGSKIEAAIIDEQGLRVGTLRAPSPKSYDHTLLAIRDLTTAIETQCDVPAGSLPLGIGTPGSASPRTRLMRNCNSTHLNGRPLAEDLARTTGRAVRMANDADCFVLSETRDGAAAGAPSVFGVIMGTGIGGGLTVNGQLLAGANGITGEWGHNRMPLERVAALPKVLLASTRGCYCGRSNCVETWLSGPGLAQTHLDLHGEDLDSRALHEGHISAQLDDTLRVHRQMLAVALAQVVNVFDPSQIVLGGGLSNMAELYSELPELLASAVFSDYYATPIERAMHGDSSGVRGAAWLW